MDDQENEQLSPTVAKVLNAYLDALVEEGDIDNEAAKRLDAFLQQGKVPKTADIDEALNPSMKEEDRKESGS